VNASPTFANLAAALAAAQGELDNASKSSENPHFRSRYADLAEVRDTVVPVLARHGLSVVQLPSYADGVVSVETVLLHVSGEYLSGVTSAPVSKQDAQGVGSAITYCRRYSLAAVACIAQDDDDGEAASGRGKAGGKRTPVASAPQADQTKVRSAFEAATTEADFQEAVFAARTLTPAGKAFVQDQYQAARERLGIR
jgi:hypothetical protein